MKTKKERLSRLQEWILVQAYKNGLTCRSQDDQPSEIDPRRVGHYFMDKHEIYRNYFRLQTGLLGHGPGQKRAFRRYWEIRLNSAVVLSRSVKGLWKRMLIFFPNYVGFKKNAHPHLWKYANYIFLTEEGAQEAKALMLNSRGRYDLEPMSVPQQQHGNAA